MALYVGDTKIKRVYHGDTPIKRIYYGDTLVWAALGVASGLSSTRNNTSFTPAWAAVEDADSYDLRWSTNANMSGATTVTGTTSGTAVTGLSALTTYYWQVRANEGDIIGDWSATQNVTTTGALSGLSSTRTRNSFTPSWTAISGLSYDMRYSTNSDMTGATTVTGTTSGTAVTGLNTSTTYYWEVRSKRGSTTGEWSSTQSVTTQDALTAPARGAAPSATGGDRQVEWVATAPNNGGSAITGYDWRWRQVGAVSWRTTVSTSGRTFTRTGLTRNTQYEAQFKAKNTIGTAADWSPSGTATTDQLAVASAPSATINSIPAGNEGTTVRLSRSLTGGLYDQYLNAWSVDEGTLDDATADSPTWTRPAVSATKNVGVNYGITVRGTGTRARAGTSDTASAAEVNASVRNVVVQLPVASAPTVSIDAVAAGNEGTSVALSASLGNDGTFDGSVGYAWTADEGTLTGANTATPTWTRPQVASDSNTGGLNLRITVRGTGTNARNGSSDTADAAEVNPRVLDVGAPPTDVGAFRITGVTWSSAGNPNSFLGIIRWTASARATSYAWSVARTGDGVQIASGTTTGRVAQVGTTLNPIAGGASLTVSVVASGTGLTSRTATATTTAG